MRQTALLAFALLPLAGCSRNWLQPDVVTGEEYQHTVLEAPRPVLVCFSANWCDSCPKAAAALERIRAEYAGRADVVLIDVDQSQPIADRYKLRGLPTILLMHQGELKARWLGVHPAEEFRDALNRILEKSSSP